MLDFGEGQEQRNKLINMSVGIFIVKAKDTTNLSENAQQGPISLAR